MGATAEQIYDSVVAVARNGDNFLVSFLIGSIVIAFHARNRLQIAAPRAEEFDFVRLLTLPAIVGKDLFRRSYIIYTVLLEILFVFLCVLKPVVPNFVGEIADYQGGAWPLGCALIVVGLLPSVKGVDQIELRLREFALSASNIPSEFFRRARSLSQSEFKGLLEREQRYQPELNKYWKVYNLVTATGAIHEEAHNAARRTLGNELFTRWTLDGGSMWSAGEYEKLADVFDVLRPKARSMKRDMDELIIATSSSKAINYILSKNDVHVTQPIALDQAQKVVEASSEVVAGNRSEELTPVDIEVYTALADRWREKSTELSVSNRRLCALFAILALNDRSTVKEYLQPPHGDKDSILREMLALVNKVQQYTVHPIYNASLVAGVGALFSCFLVFFTFRLTADYFNPPNPGRLKVIEYSLFASVTVMACFVAAGLTALFIRSVRVDQGKWIFFDGFLRFPILQYKGIVVAATICAFVVYVISTIAYAYRAGDISGFADLGRYGSLSFVLFCLVWSLIPMTFAIGLCLVTDIVERQRGGPFLGVSGVSILVVVVIALVVHGVYASVSDDYKAIFWNGLVSIGSFTGAGLTIFGFSLTDYYRREGTDRSFQIKDSAAI